MMGHYVSNTLKWLREKTAYYCACNFSVSFTLFLNLKLRKKKKDEDSRESDKY